MAEAAKKYLFVANRDITVTSTLGITLAFAKGVPTNVPRPMHAIVLEKGILPCDPEGNTLGVEAIEDPQPKVRLLVAPEDADERNDKILDAIKALVQNNDAKNFSAGGVPSYQAVSAALGWRVDAKEIRPIWAKYKPEMMAGAK